MRREKVMLALVALAMSAVLANGPVFARGSGNGSGKSGSHSGSQSGSHSGGHTYHANLRWRGSVGVFIGPRGTRPIIIRIRPTILTTIHTTIRRSSLLHPLTSSRRHRRLCRPVTGTTATAPKVITLTCANARAAGSASRRNRQIK